MGLPEAVVVMLSAVPLLLGVGGETQNRNLSGPAHQRPRCEATSGVSEPRSSAFHEHVPYNGNDEGE